MYSLRRDPNHSYYHAQYWTMNCRQQDDFFFGHRRMLKSKQQCFSSTKCLNQKDDYSNQHLFSSQKNSLKSSYSCHSQDTPLPVYRAPCTFQNSLITTDKDTSSAGIYRRSPLSSSSSSCVPDVYSPGPTSSGNCSFPPPSSNLPPPPSEWLD